MRRRVEARQNKQQELEEATARLATMATSIPNKATPGADSFSVAKARPSTLATAQKWNRIHEEVATSMATRCMRMILKRNVLENRPPKPKIRALLPHF